MISRRQVGWLLTALLVSAMVSSTMANIAMEVAQGSSASLAESLGEARKFVAKPNDPKKQLHIEEQNKKSDNIKQQDQGFSWGDLLSITFNLLLGINGSPGATDKMDTDLKNGEFSWTNIISLGLKLLLGAFGAGDNSAMDKMDNESPLQTVLSTVLSYLTGNDNPAEMAVMAKQASELINLVVSLMDALRTSLSQRSLEARALGQTSQMTEAAIASTYMIETVVRSYGTEDDICMQKYLCEANKNCVDNSSDSVYFYCQVGTYGVSYLLDHLTYTPFEIFIDAGRRGRLGENCIKVFSCNDV
ncbi:uncharacterized protein LOC143018002 [Oratosquilla oratoria]|uniref:uncharacterized protein LOC143018002 n=1 Tax=Oratosquilla oratoria TaxID=337810 RepID=UPI003F76DAB9